MAKKSQSDLSSAVEKLVRALELGKKNYKKADALMDALEKELEPGQLIVLRSGKSYRFVDKFSGKNRINVGMNARRYEFEPVVEI